MYMRHWMRGTVCALLVCAAVVAGGPGLESVEKITVPAGAVTAALAITPERLSPAAVLGESDSGRNMVLGALFTLQLAGIVAFEAWVFVRRRQDH